LIGRQFAVDFDARRLSLVNCEGGDGCDPGNAIVATGWEQTFYTMEIEFRFTVAKLKPAKQSPIHQ
jgi:hypothetical protein